MLFFGPIIILWSFFKVWLTLRLCFLEWLYFLQVFKDLLNTRIIIQAHVETDWAPLNMRSEEAVCCCNLISETILSLGFFQHFLNSLHSPHHPISGPFNLVSVEISGDFLKHPQILVRVQTRVYDFTKTPDLGFLYWVFGQQWGFRVHLI